MAETNESIIELLHLGPEKPDQPPRFAKVTAVSGDTATVTLGSASVDAVRCCDCAAGDVVLLETLPSGQLAAVGAKGGPYELYTEGDWTVRKWNDGTAECWAKVTQNVTSWTSWDGVYCSTPIQLSFPTDLFSSSPIEIGYMNYTTGQSWMSCGASGGSKTTTRSYRAVRPTAGGTGSSDRVRLTIYAIGRWL